MARGKAEYMNEIFRLRVERELLKHMPFSSGQLRKDQEISTRIRQLVDRICAEQSKERGEVNVVRFKGIAFVKQ